MIIDPWSSDIIDYEKLFQEFGIKPMFKDKILGDLHLFRRGIIFGHRDFDLWLEDFKSGKQVSILTGMMPSGPFHLGHKMVVDQLVFYQSLGVPISLLIADIEARTVRKKTKDEIARITREYLANYFALGLDPDNTDVYFQTNRSIPYYRLATLFSGKMTFSEMEAIYGSLSPGKITSALFQASDIIHKQLPEYMGKHRILVPVGPDQDPHIRLSRDLADRTGFIKPSATYHIFMKGLDGGKMSSSRPNSYIGLDEPWKTVEYKVRNALTGGRDTLKEQREKGGRPDQCMVFQLYKYHFEENDEKLEERRQKCLNGELTCGECKAELIERIRKWYDDLQVKKVETREIAKNFVEENLNHPF